MSTEKTNDQTTTPKPEGKIAAILRLRSEGKTLEEVLAMRDGDKPLYHPTTVKIQFSAAAKKEAARDNSAE